MEASYQPTERFAKWASSLSGVSGGNPKGDLWFCGIEFGGDHDFEIAVNERFGNLDITDGIPSWGNDFIEGVRDECTRWPYIQKVAKLASYYESLPIGNYKNYICNRLCRADGMIFLMNLYPLNFGDTDHAKWTKKHSDFTGLPNKTAYIAWCMQYRFPILRALVRKYIPANLICVGNSFTRDFKLAFLGMERLYEEGQKTELPSGKFCQSFFLNDGKTRLMITPFLGQGGIMSDMDLEALSNMARKRN